MHRRIDALDQGDIAILVSRKGHIIGTALFGSDLNITEVVGLLEVTKFSQMTQHVGECAAECEHGEHDNR
jgi:hypothetical protein